MPTLPIDKTPAIPSPGLSPAVLERVVRSVGIASTALSALSDFGTRVAKTANALDSMREMLEKTSLLNHAVKDLDIMHHFPSSLAFSPQLFDMPYPSSPYQSPSADVEVTDNTKTASAIQLPRGAQWSNVQCHFTDEFTLSVSYKGNYIGRYDYTKLGFGRKNMGIQKPDVQWELLYKLATLYSYEDGKLAAPTVATLAEMLGTHRSDTFPAHASFIKKAAKYFWH